MNFKDLEEFIANKMRMSQIYQPVMLLTLLENAGRCHQETIAKVILAHDPSQIEYYTKITNNMVGKVLRGRSIVEKDKKDYTLNGFESLTPENIETLKQLCVDRIGEFIDSRGQDVWQHRKKSKGYVSGTVRYEVLKNAKYRCELCGISADVKSLEVDHIIPRNHGGADDITNFQALCYSCNATKRDRDDTDLRGIAATYNQREDNCLFCSMESARVIDQNKLAYVIEDGFPVTVGHRLVIPKRHVAEYFDLGQPELNAVNQLLTKHKALIESEDPTVSGFNIGINCGEDAGQTIFHCHVHLIPRRKGDVKEPRGGIRHLIPEKGCY
ncbi:HIT domain-containing protein [Candidatus Njordibacter sp. Uisw_039]|uniref:HIT domain-containing protein n=1 Tax=Candidatus Njordibacter sp. Uisw_039 TaxID=3230972 RepID=UPI003D3D30A1